MPLSRRTFLKTSAAGALAVGAGFPEFAEGASPTKKQLNALTSPGRKATSEPAY